jgi:hypothetical protein
MTLKSTFAETPVVGVVETFDRLIFKGYLPGFRYPGAVLGTLATLGQVFLKDWKAIIQPLSDELYAHLESMCHRTGRPFEYLESAHTHRDGDSKEKMAREIAARDRISSGLVCIFRVLEPCSSYDVRGNRKCHLLELVRRRRRCLHYYAYIIDPEFGWMHVRIQSWIPFTIQVYVNGREWLCRQLDKNGSKYLRSKNKIIKVSDLNILQKQCKRLERMNWSRKLNIWAKCFNPLIQKFPGPDGKRGYFWVTDQCEYATDLLLKDRKSVDKVLPDIKRHAHTVLSVRDCYRFLGKRESSGEAVVDLQQRPEGWRGKFRLGRNSVKIYDHANIIRIETTINNPSAFTTIRKPLLAKMATKTTKRSKVQKTKRTPIRKGVQDFWLLAKIGSGANRRMIDSFDNIRPTRQAIEHLDRLSKPRLKRGKHTPRLNPTSAETIDLFKAVAAGEGTLRGFTNGEIQHRLYPKPATGEKEQRRRTCQICRRLATLRGHGLIAKISGTRRYRLTPNGRATITAAIRFHDCDFSALHAA